MVNKSAQQQNPDILDEQTKILKIKILDEILLNNKLQKNK